MSKATIKKLEAQRACLIGHLDRFQDFLNTLNNQTKSELPARIQKFENLWDEFQKVQLDLECIRESPDNKDIRLSFENNFYKLITEARSLVGTETSVPAIPQNPGSSNKSIKSIKLPEIELPAFYGDYDKWVSFHDKFQSLIHLDPTLTNVQKFHYLTSSVKGEAAEVISSLKVTDANYEIAWQLLKDRFQNHKLIISSHLNDLLNLPTINTKDAHQSLRKLIITINKNIKALKILGLPVEHWDAMIIHIASASLDYHTKKDWEKFSKRTNFPTLESFLTFLKDQCEIMETAQPAKKQSSPSANKQKQKSFASTKATCSFCKANHNISQCKNFLDLPINKRIEQIKNHKLCINCLKDNHTVINCISKHKCKHCNKKHNSLLHLNNASRENSNCSKNPGDQNIDSNQNKNQTSAAVSVHTSNINFKSNQVLLSTALVTILDHQGKPHLCRALLDSGSQSNFITSSLYKKLGIKQFKLNIPIHGVAESVTMVKGGVDATIKSRINNFHCKLTFFVLDTITDSIPASTISKNQIYIPSNLPLADPTFYKSSNVDILLGASIFWKLICPNQIRLKHNQPTFQKTKLGWVAVGHIPTDNKSNHLSCNLSSNKLLSNQLEKFWKIEEINLRPIHSKENELCQKHFFDNTQRDEMGKFIVKLPFKQECAKLGNSYHTALKRFHSLENRLNKDSKMKADYIAFLKEYELLGHMSQIKNFHCVIDNNNNNYYLPHHGVYKDSTTTKLRVVFDASAKTTSGLSLNDILMIGPNIQQELFQILIRFRKHNIVISADIEKMYRQVLVHPDHRKFQMILWRENQNESIKHFALNTVTYGTASASYLAIQCLHQLGLESKSKFPKESNIILNDFYVDDLLTGTESPEQAIQLIKNIQTILGSGGFNLRKWSSNNKQILNQSLNLSDEINHLLVSSEFSKTLGLVWNSTNDTLHYNIDPVQRGNNISKRIILSTISKLFDPLGLLGPVIIKAKLLLQQLFQLNINWDESVPNHIQTEWIDFCSNLQIINNIIIPRQVIYQNPVRIELHGFCDSSEKAYGACVYIRSSISNNQHFVRLLCAKSKVAPIKTISLPRLELCGALTLARLVNKFLSTIDLKFDSIHYWTDSTIALAWINREPNASKTFVANRVSEIQDLTKSANWNHINSKSNPADLISRGLTVKSLSDSSLWWNGPDWLSLNKESWPSNNDALQSINLNELPETKTNLLSYHNIINFNMFDKFSTFNKLQRTLPYCLRFINNIRRKAERIFGVLTTKELENSLFVLVKLAQNEEFHSEIHSLKNSKTIDSNSKLLSLNPFLDKESILRVGGRLGMSNLDYNQKHQILLPKKHKLTELIIMNEHKKFLHLGPRALLSNIRSRFWIPDGLNVIKKVLKHCIICFRAKPIKQTFQMGELPQARITPSRPFTNCGVDFAGPFNIRSSKLRNYKLLKSYLCIFICFATKAVHLEIVSDLSTESFLSCLRRFIARRGKCLNIYSDNATNFVGANNELKRITEFLKQETNKNTILNSLNQDGINWHFIPARSPHVGGIWESAVRSAKYHIKRVIGNQILTYEELSTLFTQIEACLNSRPLTPLSSDPNDNSVLTPGHFLIGDTLLSCPEQNLTSEKITTVDRYHLIVQMSQHFWERWRKDYLNSLQQRTKWRKNIDNVQLGSLVLIKEDNVPSLQWPMGRIIELHPGKDGIVRVVSIKTSTGVYKRSVNNICVLPISI